MKKENKKFNTGLNLKVPEEECKDKHCPFHTGFKVKGRRFIGKIIKKDVHGTALVEWLRFYYLPKYERYEKRRTRVKAHNPPCIKTQIGDEVKIIESRPISKTKHFVVVEKIK